MKVKRTELKTAMKAAMSDYIDWNEVNDIIPLEEVMRACNCGVSEPGDVIPVPM